MSIRSFAPKDPDEEDSFEIDFSDMLPPGDAIASIVTVFVDETESPDTALLIDRFAFAGTSVSGWWIGGTRGATYLITARITSTQGRTLDKSGYVLIADT